MIKECRVRGRKEEEEEDDDERLGNGMWIKGDTHFLGNNGMVKNDPFFQEIVEIPCTGHNVVLWSLSGTKQQCPWRALVSCGNAPSSSFHKKYKNALPLARFPQHPYHLPAIPTTYLHFKGMACFSLPLWIEMDTPPF